MGRFPTEAEMEEAEQGWIEYLSNQGEEILDETAKTFYRFNERGEVIDAMLVEPFESD